MSGSPEPDGPGGEAAAAPPLRVAEVVAVALHLPSQHPHVTLQETEPPFRQLVMPIGMSEGVSLAHALHKVPTPRPLTHELFATVLRRLSVDVVAVRLVGRQQGNYLAELVLMTSTGGQVVPCRPSDGLSLAVRQGVPAPVLVDARLFEGHDADIVPVPAPGVTPAVSDRDDPDVVDSGRGEDAPATATEGGGE